MTLRHAEKDLMKTAPAFKDSCYCGHCIFNAFKQGHYAKSYINDFIGLTILLCGKPIERSLHYYLVLSSNKILKKTPHLA